jgi:hypothetical protein
MPAVRMVQVLEMMALKQMKSSMKPELLPLPVEQGLGRLVTTHHQ